MHSLLYLNGVSGEPTRFPHRRPSKEPRGWAQKAKVVERCWTPTAVLCGLANENEIYLPGTSPSTQTATYCGSTREAGMVRVSMGKGEKGFSFESILLLFCLRHRAERNESSVFMGPNTKHHVHTLMLAQTHTHTREDWQRHINEMRTVKEESRQAKCEEDQSVATCFSRAQIEADASYGCKGSSD